MSKKSLGMAAVVAAAATAIALVPAGSMASQTSLKTKLSGSEEVCTDPTRCGDPDGFGHVKLDFDAEAGTICFKLTAKNVDPLTAGHIHEAPEGVAGPVVVPLFESTEGLTGRIKDCVEGVDPALIEDILANPEDYYVNVHNPSFPEGAIRGQLG